MRKFDSKNMKSSLSAFKPKQRTLFAALCTQRQLPVYRAYETVEERRNRVPEDAFDFVIKRLAEIGSVDDTAGWLQRLVALAHQLDGGTEWKEYAADVLVSVYSTVRSLDESDPMLALAAARAGYRIVDAYVLGRLHENATELTTVVTSADEYKVLGDPLVQRELERQTTDLDSAGTWMDLNAAGIQELFASRSGDSLIPVDIDHR